MADAEHVQDAREKQDVSSVDSRWCKFISDWEPSRGPEPRAGDAVQADGGPTSFFLPSAHRMRVVAAVQSV